MTTQCVVRAAECNSPWRGKCPKDKRGPSPARGTSRNETPDIPSGTYCLIKYGLYVIPSGFEVKGFPHPPLRGPPSPKGRLTDTEKPTVGLTRFIFSRNMISVWCRQPAAKADGYRSNFAFFTLITRGSRYSNEVLLFFCA